MDGYLEYRKGSYLVVDAQRIEVTPKTKIRAGKARSLADVPLGYEIKARGTRRGDGTFVASEIEARRNGMAFLEEDVLASTNKTEQAYVKARKVYDAGPDGKEKVVGALSDSGPQVDRARRRGVGDDPPPSLHAIVANESCQALPRPCPRQRPRPG